MIPLLLAQAEPTSAALLEWLRVLLYLIGVVGAALGVAVAVKMLRTKEGTSTVVSPQPLEVREAATFATKPELSAIWDRVDTELGRERGARKVIHEQITSMQSDLSGLRADNVNQSRELLGMKTQLDQVNVRIDEIPQRTIKLLNETKQLHSR